MVEAVGMADQLTQWRRILTRAGFGLSGPVAEQEQVLRRLIGMYKRFRSQGYRHMAAVQLVVIAAAQAVRGNEAKREEGVARGDYH